MRKRKLKHQHSLWVRKQSCACADFLISTVLAFVVVLERRQHFLTLIVTSISEWKHTSIVAVIIGMCLHLLFRRRAATALGWFKLRGHDPFRLSVRTEWWQERVRVSSLMIALFVLFQIHELLKMISHGTLEELNDKRKRMMFSQYTLN